SAAEEGEGAPELDLVLREETRDEAPFRLRRGRRVVVVRLPARRGAEEEVVPAGGRAPEQISERDVLGGIVPGIAVPRVLIVPGVGALEAHAALLGEEVRTQDLRAVRVDRFSVHLVAPPQGAGPCLHPSEAVFVEILRRERRPPPPL